MKYLSLPHIDPIRPIFGKEPFGDKDWSFEFKYDGFRGLLYINNGRSRFISRQDKVLHQFDLLADAIAKKLALKMHNGIFDGEIVTKDATNRPIFSDVLHRKGMPIYVAFDLLWHNGEDLRSKTLSERRKILKQMLPKKSLLIEQSYSVGGNKGQRLYDLMCTNDLEGVVAKRHADPYGKRTKWYKIKNPTYSQAVGRKDFFNSIRKRVAR